MKVRGMGGENQRVKLSIFTHGDGKTEFSRCLTMKLRIPSHVSFLQVSNQFFRSKVVALSNFANPVKLIAHKNHTFSIFSLLSVPFGCTMLFLFPVVALLAELAYSLPKIQGHSNSIGSRDAQSSREDSIQPPTPEELMESFSTTPN